MVCSSRVWRRRNGAQILHLVEGQGLFEMSPDENMLNDFHFRFQNINILASKFMASVLQTPMYIVQKSTIFDGLR